MISAKSTFRPGLVVLAFALITGLSGAQSTTENSADSPVLSEELEQEARAIEELLIAPCCWTQPVSEHYSGASWEIREGIRQMLAEGKTREQILEFYVAKHGKRILSAPEASGFNSLAYYLPLVFLILGIPLIVFAVLKLKSRTPVEASAPSHSKIDPRYSKLLEQELKE